MLQMGAMGSALGTPHTVNLTPRVPVIFHTNGISNL